MRIGTSKSSLVALGLDHRRFYAAIMVLVATFIFDGSAAQAQQLRPSEAVVMELFNRALNDRQALLDGVTSSFSGRNNTVSNYYQMRVTSVRLTRCRNYARQIVSCLVSYRMQTAARDPITQLMARMANVTPVRREFQLHGGRWYLLAQR